MAEFANKKIIIFELEQLRTFWSGSWDFKLLELYNLSFGKFELTFGWRETNDNFFAVSFETFKFCSFFQVSGA